MDKEDHVEKEEEILPGYARLGEQPTSEK